MHINVSFACCGWFTNSNKGFACFRPHVSNIRFVGQNKPTGDSDPAWKINQKTGTNFIDYINFCVSLQRCLRLKSTIGSREEPAEKKPLITISQQRLQLYHVNRRAWTPSTVSLVKTNRLQDSVLRTNHMDNITLAVSTNTLRLDLCVKQLKITAYDLKQRAQNRDF